MKKRKEFVGKNWAKKLVFTGLVIAFVAGVFSCDMTIGGGNDGTDNDGNDGNEQTISASISDLVASVSANTVAFSFTGENVGSTVSYIVTLYDANGTAVSTKTLSATQSAYSGSFSELASNKVFSIGVKAVSTEDSSNVITAEVQSASVTTPSATDENAVINFAVTQSDTSATLTWGKGADSTVNYFKTYYKKSTATDYSSDATVLLTQALTDGSFKSVISSLASSTGYNFKIEAYNASGELMKTQTANATTNIAYAKPQSLYAATDMVFRKSNISEDSITVNLAAQVTKDVNGNAYPSDNLPWIEVRKSGVAIITTEKGATSFTVNKTLVPDLSSTYGYGTNFEVYMVWQKDASSSKQYSSVSDATLLVKASGAKSKYGQAANLLYNNLKNMLDLGYFDSDANKSNYESLRDSMLTMDQDIYNATDDAVAQTIVNAGLSNGQTFDEGAQAILQKELDNNYVIRGLNSNAGYFYVNFTYSIIDDYMAASTSTQYLAKLMDIKKQQDAGAYLAALDAKRNNARGVVSEVNEQIFKDAFNKREKYIKSMTENELVIGYV